ncbi:MAG TPA: hypothetical protein VHA53_09145 [Nitrolancea sp.]|jgi:ABC-type Zn2+ transport system substrate-binding protein/surface adhesin|nr:hypothetical protein [Nitrolancea sp.]
MSRVRALWLSAILTVAVVLVVGAIFMRPMLTESAGTPTPSTATLVTGEQAQPVTSEQVPTLRYDDHGDEHEHDSQHHADQDDHHEDHDDDD